MGGLAAGVFTFMFLVLLVAGGVASFRWNQARAARSPEQRAVLDETRAARRAKRAEWWARQVASAEAAKADREQAKSRNIADRIAAGKRVNVPLAQVAQPAAAGGLACPGCGGMSFVPRRRMATKVAFGVASLAGRPHWVECVTCGAMFKRGG